MCLRERQQRTESLGGVSIVIRAVFGAREDRKSGDTVMTLEVAAMDGQGLSSRERQILTQIETVLGRDKRLERRLRTFQPGGLSRWLQAVARFRAWALVALTVVSVCLLVAASRTGMRTLAAAFVALCAITTLLALAVLFAWTRRPRP
jgi:hypothetical protein